MSTICKINVRKSYFSTDSRNQINASEVFIMKQHLMTDLRDIIIGCQKGKRSFQDKLYTRYSSMLFGVCLRYTNTREEAEDVMQEGFVKIYSHIKTYSMEGSFEAWMRRIMINTAITGYRKNKKHMYQQDIDEPVYQEYYKTPDDTAEFNKEELMGAIDKLPPGYKIVFNMYVIEGYKHKEIAEELGININTSKSQLSRAKQHLQNYLNELGEVKVNYNE